MDAITLLTQQHEEAKALFEQIQASQDPTEQQRLLTQVMDALKTHTKIEEEILYAHIREELTGGGKLFEEAMQEHQEAKKAMKELESLSPGSEEWRQHFEILMHGVLHHATEEETEMFPKMREEFTAERLEMWGKKMEEDAKGTLVVDLTKEELLEQAKASDIEGRSSMDKRELEEALGHR